MDRNQVSEVLGQMSKELLDKYYSSINTEAGKIEAGEFDLNPYLDRIMELQDKKEL